MLQKLNERVKGIFAWTIIILIALTFAMFGLDYYLQSRGARDALAEVNGKVISTSSFEKIYRQVRNEQAPSSQAEEQVMKQRILEDMILKTALLQAAEKSEFYASPAQTMQAIMQIPQFQENGRFSPVRYQQVLAASMYNSASLQTMLKESLMLSQQRFMFEGTEFVLPSELKRHAQQTFETRDYQYVIIPAKSAIENESISQAAVREAYDKNKKEWTMPPRVSLSYLMLSLDKYIAESEPTEEEVKQYYNDNQDSFKTPARWKVSHLFYAFPKDADAAKKAAVKQKAEQAYETLSKTPSLFNDWVKKYSDDKLSSQHDGVLPWLTLGQSDFDKTLTTMTKVGEISSPIQTSKGYELFKLIAYEPTENKPFDKVKTMIRQQLQNERAQLAYTKALETLSELSYQHPDTLEHAAKALKLSVLQTPPMTDTGEGGTEPLSKQLQVLKQAFSTDVKELGNNSEPIQLTPTSVVVIRVEKQYPATLIPFDKAKAKIEAQLKEAKAKLDLEALAKALTEGKAQLPSAYHWQSVKKGRRSDKQQYPVLQDLAFQLALPKETRLVVLPDDAGFALVQLQAVYPGNAENLEPAQKQVLEMELDSRYAGRSYDLYVHGVLDKAKIERMESFAE